MLEISGRENCRKPFLWHGAGLGGYPMRKREKRKAEVDEDDERLARAVLAEFRQGWVAQRQTMRARLDRKLLEVCALQDTDRMAFRPSVPSLTDLLCRPGGDHPARAGAAADVPDL